MQAGVGCFLPIHTNKDENIQKKMKTHRSKDQYSISSGGHPALGSYQSCRSDMNEQQLLAVNFI